MKATWKLIGRLIKRKPRGCTTPSRIVRYNKIYTEKTAFELFKKKSKSIFGFENKFSDFSLGKRIIHTI